MTARTALAIWGALLAGCKAPVKAPGGGDDQTPTSEPATTACDIITEGPVWFQDKDGDCSLGAADCDDLDPTVHPTGWMETLCDGKDNDCNGLIDDGNGATAWVIDEDYDGWAPAEPVFGCTMPAPYVEYYSNAFEIGDCNDSDRLIHPDTDPGPRTGIDVPGDGIDQDCDGVDACAPVCAGGGCGIVGDAAPTDFCEQWGQTPSFEIDPDLLGDLDLHAVDCLCAPSAEVFVETGEVASISGVEDLVSPSGIVFVRANYGGLRDFDAFAGRTEFLGDIEVLTWYNTDSAIAQLSGLRDMEHLGSLSMYGEYGATVYQGTDLADLSKLTTVDRELSIGGSKLTSLRGLESLTETGGLSVFDAPDLESIEALGSLRRVGELGLGLSLGYGGRWVPGDPKLSIRGLEFLEEVDGWVSIGVGVEDYSPLSNLVRVTGALNLVGDGACPILPRLAYVGGLDLSYFTTCDLSWLTFATSFPEGLSIWNTGITSLSGLESVTSIGGYRLLLYGNPQLQTLEALSALALVDGHLELTDNDSLATLTGLENLTTIEGDLEISGNDRLTQLDGLYGLQRVSGDIRIEDNASLTEEEIYAFLDNLGRENIGLSVYVDAVR